MSAQKNENVASLAKYKSKNHLNDIYNVLKTTDWHSATIFICNKLELPLDHNLTNKTLTLISEVPVTAGVKTLHEFICNSMYEGGLSIEWEEWVKNVTASRYKHLFGINSNDRNDILAQVDDVAVVIGRLPLSRSEFNLGAEQIRNEHFSEMETQFKLELNSVNDKLKSALSDLDKERRENYSLVQQLDNTLAELEKIKEIGNDGVAESIVLRDYVKKNMYEQIICQMEDLKNDYEVCISDYIGKIEKLERQNISLNSRIKAINVRYLELVKRRELDNDANFDAILSIKKDLAEALKEHLHEKKVNQKLFVISGNQKKLLEHYKSLSVKKGSKNKHTVNTLTLYLMGGSLVLSLYHILFNLM